EPPEFARKTRRRSRRRVSTVLAGRGNRPRHRPGPDVLLPAHAGREEALPGLRACEGDRVRPAALEDVRHSRCHQPSSRAVLACSVCGCDPAAGTLGLDRPSASSLRLAIEDRYLAKESGTGDEAESEREDRLLLRAQYSPIAPLVLQVEVPYLIFKNHLNSAGVRDDSATGLGDVTFGARYELIRVGLDARHVVALTGTVKAPTGPNARHLPNEEPDEHIQLGTGSW